MILGIQGIFQISQVPQDFHPKIDVLVAVSAHFPHLFHERFYFIYELGFSALFLAVLEQEGLL